MPWFKVDDTLHAHRKLVKAGAEAMGLWVACGSFATSAASRQDGSLDADEVAARAMLLGIRDWRKTAGRLVSAGLWEEAGDGFVFHNWEHYESPEGASEAKAEKAAQKQKAYRERKAAAAAAAVTSQPVTRYVTEGNAVTDDTGNAAVTPEVTPGNALARHTHAPHARATPALSPSRLDSTREEEERVTAPAAQPPPVLSDLGEKILAAAAKLPRVGPLVDPWFANELALIADRCGKAALAGKALDEADSRLAAQGGPVDVTQGRDVIQKFIRNALPDRPARRGAPPLQPGAGKSWASTAHNPLAPKVPAQ